MTIQAATSTKPGTSLIRRAIWPLLIPATLLLCQSSTAQAQSSRSSSRTANAGYSRMTLPVGTVLPVRLDGSLSSKNSEQGDKFTATIKSGPDDAGVPEGTRVEGVVREVQASGDGKPGVLDVDFRRMVFPNGGSQVITASLFSLNGKDVKRRDGRLVATADRGKDRLKWIGIGAGGGLLIGTLTKNNAILSTLLGAGAGYLYNEVGNKPKPGDIDLKAGSEFGIRLDRQLAFNGDDRQFYRSPGADRRTDDANENRYSDNRSNGDSGRYGGGYSSRRMGIRMLINDQPVRFDGSARPFVQNSVLFVPLAAMGNAAEFDYRFDSGNRTIYARNDSVHAGLASRTVTVDGDRHSLPAHSIMRGGSTYVPLQFIGWAANGDVDWNSGTRTANLRTRNN